MIKVFSYPYSINFFISIYQHKKKESLKNDNFQRKNDINILVSNNNYKYYDNISDKYNKLQNNNRIDNIKEIPCSQIKNMNETKDKINFNNKRIHSTKQRIEFNYQKNFLDKNYLYKDMEKSEQNQNYLKIDKINENNSHNYFFSNLDRMQQKTKNKIPKNKYLNVIHLMKNEIDIEKLEEKKQRAKSATNLNKINQLKRKNTFNDSKKDNSKIDKIINDNTNNDINSKMFDTNTPSEKNFVRKAFNNPNFYISENNFNRNLIKSIEKIQEKRRQEDFYNQKKPILLENMKISKTKNKQKNNISNKSSLKKKNGDNNNLDLTDLIFTGNNENFVPDNNDNYLDVRTPLSGFPNSNLLQTIPESRNIQQDKLYLTSNNIGDRNDNFKKKNFQFVTEEKEIEKVLQQQKKNKERMRKIKKLDNVVQKINRMNIINDEKYTQITPFIRTNVFSDDLTYEQVFRGIKTFELSHTKSRYKKNMKCLHKVFKPKSIEKTIVNVCDKKIGVLTKSVNKKIRTQDNMKFKSLILRKRENQGADYVFKRYIRNESFKYNNKNGMFIYSNGKGYKTENYERLYSNKYRVDEDLTN